MDTPLDRLTEQFRRLPGIGIKTARKLAYYMVQQPQEQVPAGDPAGVPIAPMVVFFIGLAGGIGGLVALYFAKRRRQQADYDEWAEEDEEQY